MNGTSTFRAALLCGTALVLPFAALAQAPNARPQGGQVVAGSAAIAQDAARTRVTQSTDRAAIDWRSFDIGRDHTVQFQQPSSSSVTLNRVTGPDPSQIAGRITANGQVAIVNQSGVVFHQGSQVDAAGLVVSTANTTNAALMAGGRLRFDQPGRPDARIENNGSITVREAGLAALVAPQVANRGSITARMGRVALGGAETSTIDLHGDGLMSLEVTSPVRQRPANGEALVTNTGSIAATGGTVVLTAQAVDGIVQDLVRAGGTVSADTDAATGRTGRVVVSGTGGAVRIEGAVTTTSTAANTTGGTVQVLGDRSWVAPGARVDASGSAGGGTVHVGTNGRAAAATRLARRTGIAQGATVRADATGRGNGGTVIVNSADNTVHAGEISARGGVQGGDGGFVEVSGGKGLSITGRVDVNAGLGGQVGTFLIDPTNLTIVAAADGTGSDDAAAADGVLGSAETTGDATVSNGFINAFSGNLRLEATNNLTVGAAINRANPGQLVLQAGNTLNVDAPITMPTPVVPNGGRLSLLASTLNLNGDVTLGAGQDLVVSASRITQDPATRILARSLTSQGFLVSASLPGANQLQVLDMPGGEGAIAVRNIGSLTLGTIGNQSSNTSVSIDVTGDIQVAGRVQGRNAVLGGTSVQLRATGNITIPEWNDPQDVPKFVSGNGVRLQAGFDFATGSVDPLAAGGLRLAGPVIGGTVNVAPSQILSVDSAVDLGAGRGGIVQTVGGTQAPNGGVIRATRLTMVSGGDVFLGLNPTSSADGNRIDVLGPSTVAGGLNLVTSPENGFAVSLDGAIRTDGTMTVLQRSGNLEQLAGSVLTTPLLDVRVPSGELLLTGENQIAAITGQAESGVTVRNATSLRATQLSAPNSTVSLDVTGDLQASFVTGRYGVTGLATGNITANDIQSTDTALFGVTRGVTLLAGYDAGLGDTNPSSASSLRLSGEIGNPDFLGQLFLGAGTGGVVQTGGRISGSYLFLSSGTTSSLASASAGTPNHIEQLNGQLGNLVLDNGSTGLVFVSGENGIVGNIIEVRTSGNIAVGEGTLVNATQRISLRAGGVDLDSFSSEGSPGSLLAPTVELAPFAVSNTELGGATLPDGGVFGVTSALLGATRADTLRIGAASFAGATATTANDIRLTGTVSSAGAIGTAGVRLDLNALGNVSQAAGANVDVTSLSSNVGGQLTLTNAGNTASVLADNTAGVGFAFRNSGALSVTGAVRAPNVALTTGGTLSETVTGSIGGGSLAVDAGTVDLRGANSVTALNASRSSGDFRLDNSSPLLTVPGDNLVQAGGALEINQVGGLRVAGAVSSTSGSVQLTSTGDLTAPGSVTALDAVRLRAGGSIALETGSRVASTGSPAGLVSVLAGYDTASGATNVASATSLALAGTLGDADGPGLVTLGAGTGGIVQAGGQIVSSGLTVTSGGDARLNGAAAPNGITALGASGVAGTFLLDTGTGLTTTGTVTAAGLGLTSAGDITVASQLAATGPVTLDAGGGVAETGAGAIAAASLGVRAGIGAVDLRGANTVGALTASSAAGDFRLDNTGALLTVPGGSLVQAGGVLAINQAGALRVDGAVSSTNSAVQLTSTGDMAVAGTATAAGAVRLLAGGNLALEAGSTVRSLSPTAGTVTALAGYDTASGATNPASATSLTLAGTVGGAPVGPAQGNALVLGAGTGGIVQTGGQLLGRSLALTSGGDARLVGGTAPNGVATLAASSAAGTVLLDNGSTDLVTTGPVTAARIGLRTAGAISVQSSLAASQSVSFLANTLDIPTASGGLVTAPLVEAAPRDLQALTLGSTAVTADTLRLGAASFEGAPVTTATGIRLSGPLATSGVLILQSLGDITQDAGTTLSAATLSGSAGGTATLANAGNSLPRLGSFTAGTGLAIATDGALAITDAIQAPSTALTARGGSIEEIGQGRIGGGGLSLQAAGSATLLGNNTLTSLTASSTGADLRLNNTGPLLTVPGDNLVQAGGALEINQVGGLRVAGAVSSTSGSVQLTSTGDLTAPGSVTALDAVRLRAGGSIALETGSRVASTGSPAGLVSVLAGYDTASGATNVASATSLALAGTLGDADGPGLVTLGAGTGGIVQAGGQIVSSGLTVTSGGDARLNGAAAPNGITALGASGVAGTFLLDTGTGLTTTGTVTAAGLGLTSAGDITVASQLAATGPVTLDAGGGVAETGAGAIAAASLGVRAGIGAVDLRGANTVGALTASSAAGDFRLDNTGALLTVPGGSLVQAGGVLAINQAGALRVDGAVSSTNSAVQLTSTGDMAVAGTATAAGAVRLLAGGNLALEAGSTVRSLSPTAGTVTALAGYDTASGTTNPASATSLTLAGTVGGAPVGPAQGNALVLGAGTGGIVQTGGQLLGRSLALTSGGDARLVGGTAPNGVATLAASSAAGTVLLDNGSTDLVTTGPVTAARIGLRTAGAISVQSSLAASQSVSFLANTLDIPTASGGLVTAPLVEAAPRDLQALTLGSTAVTADTLRLGAASFEGAPVTTATGIRLSGPLATSGVLILQSLGDITQDAGTTLSAATLSGSAGGTATLANAGNSLPRLGSFTAGTGLAIATDGALAITDAIQAPSTALTARGGSIEEIGQGRIGGGGLSLQASGSATLLGNNTLTALTASSTGADLRLNNTGPLLTVPGDNLVQAGGALEINQGGNLTVDGTVSGATTRLSSPSATIRVNGNSALARTGDLVIEAGEFGLAGLLRANGAIRITAGSLATLAGEAATADLRITAPRITFGGLDARGAQVGLFLGAAGTTQGAIDAGGLTLAGGAGARLTGTIAGIPGRPAAAAGRRATQDGTLLNEPLPAADQFLFNDCAIGVAACLPVLPPLRPAPDIAVGSTLADSPLDIIEGIDPSANVPAIDRLRPPVPNITIRVGRDRSEEENLAPPSIRREDY
ncbi:beta strand repeat-containing protein [Roseomonas sp. WA12]